MPAPSNSITLAEARRKLDAQKNAKKRAKLLNQKMVGQAFLGGSALIATGIVAFTMSKVPRLRYFTKSKKVPTTPVIMLPGAALGIVFQSPILFGACLGPLVHWFGGWIEQQSWAQPSG